MSDPKLITIAKAIQTNLQAIDGTGDYYTTAGSMVVRGRIRFNGDELPAIALFFGPRTNEETIGPRTRALNTIIIEAHSSIAGSEPDADGLRHPEDLGIKLLADIQRAMETASPKLGGLLSKNIQWIEDSIFYPEDSADRVAARRVYEIPHVIGWGDPIN